MTRACPAPPQDRPQTIHFNADNNLAGWILHTNTHRASIGWNLTSPDSDAPYIACDSRYDVLFHGLLHDVSELNPADFVLSAYRRSGEEMLHHLKGRFSLIIWDRSER